MPTDSHNERESRLLSAKDLAAMLGVSRRTVSRLKSAGKLPRPIRIGGSERWRRDELADWLQAGCPDRRTWEARQ